MMLRSLNPIRVALSAGLLLLSVFARVAPTYGQVVNSDSGHAYQFVPASDGPYTWGDADGMARSLRFNGMPGHLATITTELENEFLIANFPDGDGWLGGIQASGNSPRSGWRWVTGEDWNYTHWIDGEPNDDSGNTDEDRLQWYRSGWNDNSEWRTMGFFVEYEPYQLPDVVRALRITAGLEAATSADLLRLDVDQIAASEHELDLLDAVRLAQNAMGF